MTTPKNPTKNTQYAVLESALGVFVYIAHGTRLIATILPTSQANLNRRLKERFSGATRTT